MIERPNFPNFGSGTSADGEGVNLRLNHIMTLLERIVELMEQPSKDKEQKQRIDCG